MKYKNVFINKMMNLLIYILLNPDFLKLFIKLDLFFY